ncbi:MAG: recombination regulator RecX [Treponema sp.]|jgi:regulatory protein|nr:recombination regulator RecX [Treponema sp.]
MEDPVFVIEAVEPGAEPGVYKIRLSGGSSSVLDLIIHEAYLPPELREAFRGGKPEVYGLKSGFLPGACLSAEAEEALCFSQFCLAAEKAALRLIIRAEQCGAGLSRKLEQRKHSRAAVKAVLARLIRLDLVNDRRYAELWLRSRVSRGAKSPRFLLAALSAKGIDQDTVKEALRTALPPETETGLLRRFLEKNAPGLPETGLRSRLRAEGFSPAAVEAHIEAYTEMYREEEAPV